MEKPADIAHPIHEIMEKRWSPIGFSGKILEKKTIQSLFEAARWAPSAYNEQPWHFLIASRDNEDEFKTMLDNSPKGCSPWIFLSMG